MRDEPWDTPIPEEFKPSSYNAERLTEARAELLELRKLTPEQLEVAVTADYEAAKASHEAYEAKEEVAEQRLIEMLDKVKVWQPPTADHVGLKDFMIQQIDISRRGTYRREAPKKLEPQEWLRQKLEQAEHDIGYHAAEHAKEVERTRARTDWIKTLRASL